MPTGRPTDYNEETTTKMCERIATGDSVRTICSDEDMPSVVTFFAWAAKYPEFLKRYEEAKVLQADFLAEEMLSIADDGTNDYMETLDDEGGVSYKINGEHVQRSRLRLDTRKWIASKLKPKKYGDHTRQDINLNVMTDLTDAELAAKFAAMKKNEEE